MLWLVKAVINLCLSYLKDAASSLLTGIQKWRTSIMMKNWQRWLSFGLFNLSRNAVLVTSRNPHNVGILSRGPAKVGGGGGG